MADCMAFPKTAEEFIEQYKFTDTKQEYTNGAELMPVFRVKQMLEHYVAEGNHVPGKWIPVTERLPERDGKYLCNYHFSEHRNMTFTQVLDYYATDKAPHFQHENSYGMKVSHWMPLPEPPKGE